MTGRNLNTQPGPDTLRGLIDHYEDQKKYHTDPKIKDAIEKQIAKLRMQLTLLSEPT